MSCLRVNGPVRFPSSAMYQMGPSSEGGGGMGGRVTARRSIGGAGGGVGSRGATMVAWAPVPRSAGAPPPTGRAGEDGLRAPSSRTVMMFAQDLHRTLRIFPRTLSSAMEYLVWQRSQTNFMGPQRQAPTRPFQPQEPCQGSGLMGGEIIIEGSGLPSSLYPPR